MKITNDSPFVHSKGYVKQVREKRISEHSDGKVGGPVVGEDNVSLSARSLEIQEARGALADVPDVRQDKVEAMKERIAGGTYSVDTRKLAMKILGEVLLDDHL